MCIYSHFPEKTLGSLSTTVEKGWATSYLKPTTYFLDNARSVMPVGHIVNNFASSLQKSLAGQTVTRLKKRNGIDKTRIGRIVALP